MTWCSGVYRNGIRNVPLDTGYLRALESLQVSACFRDCKEFGCSRNRNNKDLCHGSTFGKDRGVSEGRIAIAELSARPADEAST